VIDLVEGELEGPNCIVRARFGAARRCRGLAFGARALGSGPPRTPGSSGSSPRPTTGAAYAPALLQRADERDLLLRAV